MGLDRLDRRGLLRSHRPPDQTPVVPAGDQRLAIQREGHRSDPALVPSQLGLIAALYIEPPHATVLRPGKDPFAGSVEATRDERRIVRPVLGDVRFGGIGLRRLHHLSSRAKYQPQWID